MIISTIGQSATERKEFENVRIEQGAGGGFAGTNFGRIVFLLEQEAGRGADEHQSVETSCNSER